MIGHLERAVVLLIRLKRIVRLQDDEYLVLIDWHMECNERMKAAGIVSNDCFFKDPQKARERRARMRSEAWLHTVCVVILCIILTVPLQ